MRVRKRLPASAARAASWRRRLPAWPGPPAPPPSSPRVAFNPPPGRASRSLRLRPAAGAQPGGRRRSRSPASGRARWRADKGAARWGSPRPLGRPHHPPGSLHPIYLAHGWGASPFLGQGPGGVTLSTRHHSIGFCGRWPDGGGGSPRTLPSPLRCWGRRGHPVAPKSPGPGPGPSQAADILGAGGCRPARPALRFPRAPPAAAAARGANKGGGAGRRAPGRGLGGPGWGPAPTPGLSPLGPTAGLGQGRRPPGFPHRPHGPGPGGGIAPNRREGAGGAGGGSRPGGRRWKGVPGGEAGARPPLFVFLIQNGKRLSAAPTAPETGAGHPFSGAFSGGTGAPQAGAISGERGPGRPSPDAGLARAPSGGRPGTPRPVPGAEAGAAPGGPSLLSAPKPGHRGLRGNREPLPLFVPAYGGGPTSLPR
uniref:Uncharacterized protein n=1 Tax=Pipistrellus kuhlii TaxID=59472 RepID=A0A7J7SF86_PIPKU|nr:hypothetical protein mPipKuh1_010004 [Pipistrellus kuhlii]